MADLSKFEKMLELLINEDKEAAEELFHEIVVEKSRDIYESLLEDEDEEVDESDDEEVDESDEDLDESDDEEVDESEDDLDEGFDLDEFEVEADPMDMGGDPTDDMMADLGMDDEEGDDMDMDDEGDTEDRLDDLEDALEDLKAEFEKLMGGDDEDDMDMDDEEGDDIDDEGDDEEEKESFAFEDEEVEEEDDLEEAKKMKKDDKKAKKTAGEEMREYVEKINGGFGAKIGGDNGQNTKSAVAGKNDMGGTSANIAKSAESKDAGTKGGLAAPTTKDMNTKNVNVPGAKGATKMSNQPGHGAEKKGKPETADKSAGSMLNGAPKRAK
jgi:hypothetical protein